MRPAQYRCQLKCFRIKAECLEINHRYRLINYMCSTPTVSWINDLAGQSPQPQRVAHAILSQHYQDSQKIKELNYE